ncbi:MAG: metal ABC transporter permease [Spirochaetales bacterium]|nr:metal ABC transporter permease [Spirochaetales bacterium]
MIKILSLFSYDFILRALIAGSLVALCSALLGVILVLKRYSMIGDGLSHVGFGAIAIAMTLNVTPLVVSLPVSLAAAFFLLRISSKDSGIKGDAAIALISTSALAIGILVTSVTCGLNTDVTAYLFGSVLALSNLDVWLSIILSVVVLTLFIWFYHRIFAVTFDEPFATASGISSSRYNRMIALLTALTIVIGMRLMGAMMISSLIIFPVLTSMRVFKSFRSVTISSAVLSVICFFIGLVTSFIWSAPAGASIVVANLVMFLIFATVGKIRK